MILKFLIKPIKLKTLIIKVMEKFLVPLLSYDNPLSNSLLIKKLLIIFR